MALNVSVVLRANADQLEGELGEAKAALRGLGTEAKSAGGAMSTGMAQGSGAVGRLRGLASTVAGSFRTARGALAQLGMQAQDVAVGLAGGQSPFTVLAQQGSQIASIFGPGGAIVGAAVAGAGLIAATFFKMGDGLSEVERAAASFKTAMEGVNDVVGKGIVAGDKLAASYAAMSGEMRRSEALRVGQKAREQLEAIPAQRAAMLDTLRRLEAEGRGGDADFFTSIGDPSAGLRDLRRRFEGGGLSDIDVAEELQRLADASPALQDLADQANTIARASIEATEQLRQLGEAASHLSALSAGAEAELGGRFVDQLLDVQREVRATTDAIGQMYHDVVGGSYIPDMVTEASAWFDRLATDMTGKTEAATSSVAEHFAGLDRQVSYRLGSMIAHGKTTLTDFADFAQDILGQILGSLIGAGFNAGIGGLFAGGGTAAAGAAGSGQAMPLVMHRGGIVGAAGNQVRLNVPWSSFIGAERYHRGGLVAGEVPAILKKGERVIPAGESAGQVVNIFDQRRGGEPIETRQRRGPNGLRELDVFVRDRVGSQLASGQHDAPMAARFGLRPALGTR